MTYGILYQDGQGRVHVTFGDVKDRTDFTRQLNILNGSTNIKYARYKLTSEAEQVFQQISSRSGNMTESELPAILAQLETASVSLARAKDFDANRANAMEKK